MRTLIILLLATALPSMVWAQKSPVQVALGQDGRALFLDKRPQGFISEMEVALGEVIAGGHVDYSVWASAHVREDEVDYLIVVAGRKEYVETSEGAYFRIHPEFTFKVKEGGMFSIPIRPVETGTGSTLFPSTWKVIEVDSLSVKLEKYHSSLVKLK